MTNEEKWLDEIERRARLEEVGVSCIIHEILHNSHCTDTHFKCKDCGKEADEWLNSEYVEITAKNEKTCLTCKHSGDAYDVCAECLRDSILDNKQYSLYEKMAPGVSEHKEAVNHPKHYNRDGAIECLKEFEIIYGKEATKYACLFNIHKYRYRAADKNGQEDLKKSDFYMRKYKELCDE